MYNYIRDAEAKQAWDAHQIIIWCGVGAIKRFVFLRETIKMENIFN